MPSKIKVQAKEVSEAIAKGLKELGLRRDQVEVTVLESPKKGFLGIGSRPAVVELRQKRWSTADLDSQIYMDVPKKRSSKSSRGGRNRKDRGEASRGRRNNRRSERFAGEVREVREKLPKANEPQLLPSEAIQHAVIPENLKAPMQEAKDYLEKVLTHMGVKVENLNVWWDEKQQRILLTFDCDHPAIVIGKEGKTVEAIQYLTTLALSRHFDKPISVITDTQNYWRKAEDKIDAEIAKGIDMIKRGHSVFRFRPMSAQLRRYIHRAVEGNEFVSTASEGEGKWRKVTLRPTEKALEALRANTAPADFVPGVIGEDIPEETPAQQAVAEAEAEKALNEYHESCSCCSGEAAPEATPAPAVQPQAAQQPTGEASQAAAAEAAPVCEPTPAQETVTVQETITVQETVTVTPAETPAAQEQPSASAEQTPAAETVQPAAQQPAAAEQPACNCGPLFETPAENNANETK